MSRQEARSAAQGHLPDPSNREYRGMPKRFRKDDVTAATEQLKRPTVGDTLWIWVCDECGLTEGTAMQGGCCRYCGRGSKGTRMMVRVEVVDLAAA